MRVRTHPALPFVLIVVCAVLCGCISGPSTDVRSPEVSGRVLDSQTLQPLPGASVALHNHPTIRATTDPSGCFVLRGTKNIHLFTVLGICSTSFPEGKYYGGSLDITNAGYISSHVDAYRYLPQDVTNPPPSHLVLRDILLMPNAK